MNSTGVAARQAEDRTVVRSSRSNACDLLRTPGIGRLLRRPHARTALQTVMLCVGLVMVAHAFWGPQLAPKNLAALLTWVHFRGLVVLVVLFGGNLFCMSCPMMLLRDVARRWIQPRWEWPRLLRNKWPSLLLFVGVLFLYELFDLWSDPWWTGVMIVGYFIAAIVVDVLFRRATFCKYVCPIGQFNFLASTVSPWEVAVREPQICTTCRTKDCLLGVRPATPDHTRDSSTPLPIIQRGCELGLYQPRKIGNLDCTFCLDCVYACPHDNVGILSRLPGETLARSGSRSGLGRIEGRFDWTALSVVFTFGAILNAFAMIGPVYSLEEWIANMVGVKREWPILGILFGVLLIVLPVILLAIASTATRRLSDVRLTNLAIAQRFSQSLVPLGFGIWLAHYGFHFFTGCLTIVPVTQNAILEGFGRAWLGEPLWQLGGLPESVVLPLEMGFLALGLIGSWLVAWSVARELSARRTISTWLPWASLHLCLVAWAVWIMHQPMDMRGTFLGG